MQVLHIKHELRNCHLACEGEVGSERTNRHIWLNRLANRPKESTQELRSSHGAKILHLAFAGEGGGKIESVRAANATIPLVKSYMQKFDLCMS